MTERVVHCGFVGQASYCPEEDAWSVSWRPTDPMWRLSLDAADVEWVAGRLYGEAMERWHEAVEVFVEGQEGRANGCR